MQDRAIQGNEEPRSHRQWHTRWRLLLDTLVTDWQGTRLLCFGLLLLAVSAGIVAAYYLNHPLPDANADTPTYLAVAQQIVDTGNPVDPVRTPGYPLFIALFWLARGSGHLGIVSVAQGGLFILATLEIYLIAWFIWKRAWIGLVIGFVMASNTFLLSYIKPIIVEPLSLWLDVSLTLATVWYLQRVSVRRFWLVAVCLLAAFMTRPEWVYLPVLLLGYLLLVAARRGQFRRFLPHMLAAVVTLYGLLGLFIYENATQYGYTGITVIQNVNLLGKVMQYDMQDEAPPQYAEVMREVDAFLATPSPYGRNPYRLEMAYPDLGYNHWALSGSYASAVVRGHPVEFLLKSLPIVFTLPTTYFAYSQINFNGPFGWELQQLQRLSRHLYPIEWAFPFWAFAWLALLCWRRIRRWHSAEAMSIVILIALYDLFLVAFGAYGDYRRFRAPIEPVVILIVWGSALAMLAWGWEKFAARRGKASAQLQQAAGTKQAAKETSP